MRSLARSARVVVLLLVALVAAPTALRAQPASPSSAPDEANKPEALRHFKIGLELFDKQVWDAALSEFMRSRELYPTRAALKNAAACLSEIKRYDEALDMVDELADRFGATLNGTERAFVDDQRKKLADYVGTIALTSDQPGARVVIDGRERGTTPLAKPVRVMVGTHALTVTKSGFAPFEARIMVSSRESKGVDVKLASLSQAGRLRVVEESGAAADVVIDGAVVGKTPWEGELSAGTHSVGLRGTGDTAAATRAVKVDVGTTSEVKMTLVALLAKLRVEPTPPSARVTIDGRAVGAGAWEGEIATGKHVIEVSAEGYVTARRDVVLSAIVPEVIRIALDRTHPDEDEELRVATSRAEARSRWRVLAYAGPAWGGGGVALTSATAPPGDVPWTGPGGFIAGGVRYAFASILDFQARLSVSYFVDIIPGSSSYECVSPCTPGQRVSGLSASLWLASVDATVRLRPGAMSRWYVGAGPYLAARFASASGNVGATDSSGSLTGPTQPFTAAGPAVLTYVVTETGFVLGEREQWDLSLRTMLGPKADADLNHEFPLLRQLQIGLGYAFR